MYSVMKLFLNMFCLLLCLSNSFSFDGNCHNGLTDIKEYLVISTPYRFVAYENSDPIQFDGCHPEKVIGFIRHGTRNPSDNLINKMKYELPVLKERIFNALITKESNAGLLCSDKADNIYSWEFKVSYGEKWLTDEGEDEMVKLAERLKKRLPQLLAQPYSNATYFFKHTHTQRAQESAKYFTIGLFGGYKFGEVYFPKSIEKDPILRFYKGCDKWMKTVKKNPRAFIEHYEFIIGDDILKTSQEISKRLGLKDTLTYDDIHLMYSTCIYETAWHKDQLSPWCSLFSEFDFENMAYGIDLKHYWLDGYGHELTSKIACPAVKHTLSFLESNDPSNATAVFYFTHSGTILKMLSHFGLYKDPYKLTSSLTKEERDQRKWKTSAIDTFGANIIFVSFDCNGEKKVLTLHQERPVRIPGCPDDDLCPLSLLLNNFKDSMNNCNMHQLCSFS